MKLTKFIALIAAVATFAVGCEQEPVGDGGNTSGGAVLAANNASVEVNTPITFTVTATDGTDITAQSTIFDKTHDFVEVPNPFTPTVDGNYEFYAVSGSIITDAITVSVVPTIPAIPEDGDKANTSFNHRILLVDHTGTGCSYCPQMMKALKSVSETGDYHSKYYEAMAHTYGAGDPASSSAAYSVSGYYRVNSYPTLTYNFQHSTTSSYNDAHIKQQIDALWKANGADAGIAAAASLASSSVVVNIEVKAAVANDYRVVAWLLEDGIEAKQTNATEDWMNVHDNAIRQASTTEPITGHDLGTIAAGATADTALTLEISTDKWVRDNLKVLIIVSAKGADGKFEVANVAMCPANGSVEYDYK
ncbi:MAG: Omp28-related outer membrane protein [Alistipes sp.]|nr:Omp28-related outer membrane protein [Alistipes sp.]